MSSEDTCPITGLTKMIVMGRHGKRKGLKKLLMGSTVSKLISHTPCKVLVVP